MLFVCSPEDCKTETMTSAYNVVCVKAGPKYGPDYVNKLYSMCRRHITLPFRFVCLTDDVTGVDDGIECLPLPDPQFKGVWHKLSVFRPRLYDITGRILMIDVDVVIVDNMDGFLTLPGSFCINLDWNAETPTLQGSIYRLEAGSLPHVYERLAATYPDSCAPYRGEQGWLTANIKEWTTWPDGWSVSYKKHCDRWRWFPSRVPKGAKIVNFHGIPNPPDALRGHWTGKKGELVRRPRARWIAKHWR